MVRKYTDEMISWLKENIKGTFYRDLTKKFNEKFNTNFSQNGIKTTCDRYNLKNGMKGIGYPHPKMFNKEEIDWIREVIKGKTYVESQKVINEHFNRNLKVSQVKGLLSREHLQTGTKGFFKPGHTPMNKGKKMSKEMYEKCSATMFKKGQASINRRPVGSRRITIDGYIEIKTKDPSTWELEHRIVWEKENGPVPKNHVVVHLDGNKSNNKIENLRLVHRKYTTIVQKMKGFTKNAEVTNLAIDVATLKRTITEKKGKKNG